MNNTTGEIKLSEAEIAFIKAKREADEAAAAVEKAKRDKRVATEILAKETLIAKDHEAERLQNNTAINFLLEFPTAWKKKESEYQKTYQVLGDYLNPENPKECDWKREVAWEKTETFKRISIVKGDYEINVFAAESGYNAKPAHMDLRGISYEFRKNYTRVKTVLKKIKELEDEKSAKIVAVEKAKNAKEQMQAKLETMFPDATIKVYEERKSSYSGRRGSAYTAKMFRVDLKNGSYMEARYYEDLSVSVERMHVSIPKLDNEKDPLKKLEIMNTLNF